MRVAGKLILTIVFVLSLLALGAVASPISQDLGGGPTHANPLDGWTEVGNAGDLPDTAQVPTGVGALTSISGVIASDGDADMYKICLTGGGTFSATTNPPGSYQNDTQLFLFDAAGMGVYANDDSGGTLGSTLPAGDPLTPTEPGVYYLAISNWDNDPVSPGGLIFPSTPFSGVFGPTGPGGGLPISGWTGGFGTESYTIALTGAIFCSEVLSVDIDIKPVSYPNSINLKSKGVIPVAILTTEDFDAATVDSETVVFAGASPVHYAVEDVDHDGDYDLIMHFRTRETDMMPGDTEACLTGETYDGVPIVGCDSVRTVP